MKFAVHSLFAILLFSTFSFAGEVTCTIEIERMKWMCEHPQFGHVVKTDFKPVHQTGSVEAWCFQTNADGTIDTIHQGPYTCIEDGSPTPAPQPEPQPQPQPEPQPQPQPDLGPLPQTDDPTPVTFTDPAVDNPVVQCGSIILTDNQVLGETVPIVGANFQLAYFTNKVIGRTGDYALSIPLTSNSIDTKLKQVKYTITINGTVAESKTLPISKNLRSSYIWNGQTAGKPVLGSGLAEVVVEYLPGGQKTSFAVPIGSLQAKYFGFGNWVPTNFHFYDVNRKQLLRGDGSSLSAPAELISNNQLRVIDSDRSVVYLFEASTGRHLQTKTFWLGTTLYTFNYDQSGLLGSISEPFGKSTTFNRNKVGELLSIVASNGQVTQVTLDANKFLSSVISPANQTYSFTYYDTKGMLKTYKKPQGQISTFTYDTLGNLIQDAHSGGYAVSLEKNIDGPNTYVFSTTQMGRYSQAISQTRKKQIEGSDKIVSVLQRTEYQADGTSSLSIISEGSNYFEKNGVVEYTTTIPDQRFKEYATVLEVKAVSGSTSFRSIKRQESYTFVDNNNPFSIKEYYLTETDQNGFQTRTAYSGESKAYLTITPRGTTVYTAIDDFERPLYVQVGKDLPLVYVYKGDKLLGLNHGDRSEVFTYDSESEKLIIKTNAIGQQTKYTYDAAGRLATTEYPDGKKNAFNYDENGKLIGVTPADKPRHSFSFNALELVTSYLPPTLADNSQTPTSYTYNADKQLLSVTKPDGKKINYNYDEKTGVLKSIISPEGTYSYAFDKSNGTFNRIITPTGLETRRSWADGVLAMDYLYKNSKMIGNYGTQQDSLGRTIWETAGDTQARYAFGREFGAESKIDKYDSQTVTYDNESGRVIATQIVSGSAILTSDNFSYNGYGELSSYVVNFKNSKLYSLDLVYNKLGKITQKIESIKGVSQTYEYEYDIRGRLAQVKKNGAIVGTYKYDGNGNRTSGVVSGQTISATYDAQDRLTTYNTQTYQYNLNGELVAKKNSITNQMIQYSFNSFGALNSVKLGSNTASYDMDGLGRRTQNLINGKIQSTYIYKDSIHLIGVVGADGKFAQQFGYFSKTNVPDLMWMNNEIYRIVSDNLGSVRLVVRVSDGKIFQEMLHDEFGKVTKNSLPGFQPFGYAGGLFDQNTNLVQFGARWYDSEVGRWISKDPSIFAGLDINLYGYVFSDPVNMIDASGLIGQRPMPGIPDGAGFDEDIDGGPTGSGGGAAAAPIPKNSTVYVSPNGQAAVAPEGSIVGTARSGTGLKINLPNGAGEIRLMEPLEPLSPNGYGKILQNGSYRDTLGNSVRRNSPEAHIQPNCPWKGK